MVADAVSSVLSLLILMAVGYYMAGLNWFKGHGSDLFSKYSVRISIPCYMVYNVVVICGSRDELFRIIRYIPIPLCTLIISLGLGLLLAKAFKIKAPRRGVFVNVVTFSNTVIIGFPVVTSLFGETATAHAMVYYMANTIVFWTIGAYLLRLDSGEGVFKPSDFIKQVLLSPPIVGFCVGAVIVLLNFELPAFIFNPLKMIKDTVTPIAMMFTGTILRQTDFREIRLTRDLVMVLVSRFLFAPLLVGTICCFLPVDPLLKQVLFILSTMPAMTQLGIIAKESGSDYRLASVLVAVTTTVSMAALPLYAFILTRFGLFV